MEEYEEFCEKSLARIQEASLSTESFLPVQSESISLIRFHGVAVLSPLLNIEKRKEMQQEKQKALEVEARKQVNRKNALLTRVQEIIENVQVRKAPNTSDFDQWETETVYSNSEVRTLDVPATFPNVLPSPSEHSTFAEFEKLIGILPLDTEDQFKSNGIDLTRDSEEFNSLKQCDSSNMSHVEKEASLKSSSAAAEETLISDGLFPQNEKQDPSLLEEVASDPYIMSLQNLMKKSKEYIEREHSRRSLRSSAKRSVNESHSDKENDAGRVTAACVKEEAPPTGRPCGPVIPDKPSLNKSNVLLQGASTQASSTNTAVLGSFSNVDIPAGTGYPTVSDPDSDFKVIPTFVTENNVIKSLTNSYAILPSPEPSLSPKMHRRRSRPSSACHILINNPVNACELSPKGKEQAVDLAVQDADEETNVPETVPKLPIDLTRVCSSKVYVGKNTSEAIQEMVLGKSNQVCQSSGNQLEKEVIHGLAVVEGQLPSDAGGPHTLDGRCITVPRSHEPCATGPCVATQNFGTLSGLKSASMSEKNRNLQMELNKSYDVKNPSPLLMQNPNTGEQMDTPTVSCGNERFLDNSFEKVKRRLDLDIDGLQKENCPYVMRAVVGDQERQPLPERRYPVGSVCINKNHFLESSSKEGEETLKSKMLAFEEMRKRLEEHHAQQLSLLVAEQEREQEQLQKEIEEQEKTFKEKKLMAAEASELGLTSAVGLEWRRVSGSGVLETVLSHVDSLQASHSHGSGFTNSALQHSFGSINEAPFYLWGSSASGLTKLSVTRPFGRAITKWSQVFSPEIQTKFNKVTAVAKGFLTRRLMQTDKLKQLRQTVKDTMEFIRSFQSEAPLKRGVVSAQDASLQERVLAQLRAALYGIHDIFFVMDAAERMSILRQDREARKEKMLRQMDKMKSPRVALSAATQKSLDRKKYMKAAEMGMPNKKFLVKQNPLEARVLQPNQGQNAPVHRLLSRQGTPKTSVKGVVQDRQTSSRSRAPSRAPVSGVYAGKIQRKRPNVATI
ncbi:centriolar coiled-coil protein of 110 kDa isoform X1 [Pteropus vampyrus]|uniref:Centriolar coiled-coil protein of 110 kDa isoform X1 n=1 Tax=Pteropus vampyrus TaxID=132908 RepID=A0A6P3R616_PTEVA|nr:centriolar coiled-coil protein of 110 kDa isoform X1 [Pteropus vampyrus]XP_011375819.1 centriolar coiled-coil protein of 110 kDa isoform X1 [Pteropus vampyrus]XP_011375820.1 centriolar coiled-coil protein of 110 kDa isoform X1 [Pteropus vampyrus]XP_011375821.1 centriolar coiled-coil protein of 110 kDa isoform X1 [Pteropus vampyrus]XP_011375822.1 centriolar coiled-coil protein of 110 kDa isoform X1 [Pteropus vampyrus]XP_023377543.1 centriolar coiled-coil protein of 110 kDa isoform X1 [Pterop